MTASVHTIPRRDRIKLAPGQTVTLRGRDAVRLSQYSDERAIQEGTYELDLSQVLGQAGMRWSMGVLQMETHPDLKIFRSPGQPSKYWDIRNHPLVEGMWRRVMAGVGRKPYRLKKPGLPPHLATDAAAVQLRDTQYDLLSDIFAEWTARGARGWIQHTRSSVTSQIFEGYSWSELCADTRTWRGSNVVWPRVPEWRAPWAIQYLLHQRETLVGLVATFGQAIDRNGKPGPYCVAFPAEKFILSRTGALGSDLGRSWLRAIYNEVLGDRTTFIVESLGAEVNAIGELWVTEPEGNGLTDAQRQKIQDHIMNRKSSHAPGGILPYGCTIQRLAGEVPDLSGISGRRQQAMTLAWGQDDRLMSLTTSEGSRAARETASDDADSVLDDMISEMVAEPTEELLRRILEINWPGAPYYFTPTLQWWDDDAEDGEYLIKTITPAIQSGALTWSPADEAELRRRLGWIERQQAPQDPPQSPSMDPVQAPEDVSAAEPDRYEGIDFVAPRDVSQAAAQALEQNLRLPREQRVSAALVAKSRMLASGQPLSITNLYRIEAALEMADTPLEYAMCGGDAARAWLESIHAQMEQGASDNVSLAEAVTLAPARYDHIDFTPPAGVRAAAKRALEVRAEKPASERGMTGVGIARARDLANGREVSPETARRMKAYFDRHQSDKDGSTWDEQGKGWQAWQGWGGDAGYSWARKLVRQMDAADQEGS